MKPELQVAKKKSLCEGIISTFLMTVIGIYAQTSFRLLLGWKIPPKSTVFPLLFVLESCFSLTTAPFQACNVKHLWVDVKTEHVCISVRVAKDNGKVSLTSSSVVQQSLRCSALLSPKDLLHFKLCL